MSSNSASGLLRPLRARVTCIVDGQTLTGTSDFFTITSNRMNAIPPVELGVAALQPVSIEVSAASGVLTSAGVFNFTVRATDSNNPTPGMVERTLSITITPQEVAK